MKKCIITIAVLLAAIISKAQTISADVNFLSLSREQKTFRDTLFINPTDKDGLNKFYKKYEARTLPVYIKSGKLMVNSFCGSVLAICIDVSKHSKITLSTKLNGPDPANPSPDEIDIDNLLNQYTKKHIDSEVDSYWKWRLDKREAEDLKKLLEKSSDTPVKALGTAIEKLAQAAQTRDTSLRNALQKVQGNFDIIREKVVAEAKKQSEDDLVQRIEKMLARDVYIINLSDYLARFYLEKIKDVMDCCPDEQSRNALAEAHLKVCQLLSIKNGLTITIDSTPYSFWAAPQGMGNSYQDFPGDQVPKIDPRKYLVLEEHKRKPGEVDTLWDDFVRIRTVVDSRSEVIIRFKQDELRKEIFFRGNISLMAQINDSDPIEVPPYSIIGENYSTVGMKSLSPYEFALSFVTEMMDVYELSKGRRFQKLDSSLNDGRFNQELLDWLRNDNRQGVLHQSLILYLNKRIAKFKADSTQGTILRNSIHLSASDTADIKSKFKVIVSSMKLDPWLVQDWRTLKGKLDSAKTNATNEKVALIKYIETVVTAKKHPDFFFGSADKNAIGFQLEEYFRAAKRNDIIEAIYQQIGTDAAYSLYDVRLQVNAILKDGKNQSGAVSYFMEVNLIDNINFALKNLKDSRDYFNKFLRSDQSTIFAVLAEIHRDSLYLAHAVGSLNSMVNKLQPIHDELVVMKNTLANRNADIDLVTRYKLEDLATQSAIQLGKFVGFVKDFRKFEDREYEEARKFIGSGSSISPEQWTQYMASKAARQLYKKLIIGKIDLTKRNITDDSKLTIYVLWYEDPGKPAQKLPVASFTLRKLGWNEQITDSFLLINRLNDPGVTVTSGGNNATVPTSRFKGAPGASFMWTYTAGEDPDFFQKLQPSFGINLSYLDFEPTESFEVGVGAMMGLWKNKVFIGWGRNLHVPSQSTYFSIGFSFGRIAEKWNSSQSSNQTSSQ